MQISELSTGGHKVDELRWNNQILYKRQIETLPFDTYTFHASYVNSLPEVSVDEELYKPNKYLDFSGLLVDENVYNENNYTYYRVFMRTTSASDPLCAGNRIKSDGGRVNGPIIYFKILIPEGESVRVDWVQAGRKEQTYTSWTSYEKRLYFFWSNYYLLGQNRRAGLNYNYVEEGKTFSANANMPLNFENSDSLFQYYKNKNILYVPTLPPSKYGNLDTSNGYVIDDYSTAFPHTYELTLTNTSNRTLPYYIYYNLSGVMNGGKTSDYFQGGFQDITITKLEDTE